MSTWTCLLWERAGPPWVTMDTEQHGLYWNTPRLSPAQRSKAGWSGRGVVSRSLQVLRGMEGVVGTCMLRAPGAGVQGSGGLRGRQPRRAHRQQPWEQHQCSQAAWEVAPGLPEGCVV